MEKVTLIYRLRKRSLVIREFFGCYAETFLLNFDGLNYVSFRRRVYSLMEQPNMSLETQELEPPSQPHHKRNFRTISHLRY